MDKEYIVCVDHIDSPGTLFKFINESKMFDFIKICLDTAQERTLQIEVKLKRG